MMVIIGLTTHTPLEKMAAILATIFCISVTKHICISIEISLKLVAEGPIDNSAALV